MKGDRLRVPVESEYTQALGMACYVFARLEWQVVWCMEKIRPESISKVVDEEMTAGKIAKKFADSVRNMHGNKYRDQLEELAIRFLELVKVRNDIVHGKPCTSANGDQRLSSKNVIEVADLESAADDFAECSSALNSHYYNFLSSYVPNQTT